MVPRSTLPVALLALLAARAPASSSTKAAAWKQDVFVIGSFLDPPATDHFYGQFRAANFTVMLSTYTTNASTMAAQAAMCEAHDLKCILSGDLLSARCPGFSCVSTGCGRTPRKPCKAASPATDTDCAEFATGPVSQFPKRGPAMLDCKGRVDPAHLFEPNGAGKGGRLPSHVWGYVYAGAPLGTPVN